MMEEFIRDYESFKKEFPDSPQSWFIEETAKVVFNEGNIFSVEFANFSYTGGAHPNSYVQFINFDLKTGGGIGLKDLFNKNSENVLTKITESEFRRLKELGETDDMNQAGFWFENNRFSLNDNFLITDSNLVFYYNNYEITAYAFGPTELVLPYPAMEHLIKRMDCFRSLWNNHTSFNYKQSITKGKK